MVDSYIQVLRDVAAFTADIEANKDNMLANRGAAVSKAKALYGRVINCEGQWDMTQVKTGFQGLNEILLSGELQTIKSQTVALKRQVSHEISLDGAVDFRPVKHSESRMLGTKR